MTPWPHSAAAERNKQPILAELLRLLPPAGALLEIASGTGQHAAHCAAALPGWRWQPTEADAALLPAIAARCAGLPNASPPLLLDVRSPAWPVGTVDALFCANMVHIAPWDCCVALLAGAGRHLRPGGLLVLYGPYAVDGEPLADGNRTFDADLRRRDPAWGLRRLQDVADQARHAGLALRARTDMPANNLLLAFAAR